MENQDKAVPQQSNFLSLNLRDIGRGLLMAVLGSFLGSLSELLTVDFQFNYLTFKPAIIGAISAGVGYLLKNLFTKPDTKTD